MMFLFPPVAKVNHLAVVQISEVFSSGNIYSTLSKGQGLC